jgi:hypothetical protein
MNTQQFGNTKLKPLTDSDIQKLDQQTAPELPPIPDENDPFVAARKAKESKPAPKKDDFEDKAINMHPVLKKLKKTLGINRVEIFTETVYVGEDAIKFGFTEYPENLNLWCITESRRMLAMGMEEEKAMKAFDILRVGCSLVAIDGVPSYEVYGINPQKDELRANAFDMSERLRQAVAIEFHNFVTQEGRAFVDILEDFWQKNIYNRVNITSSGNQALKEGEAAYICEVPGCSFTHIGKAGQPYFCINHSTTLKKALTASELDSIPFP